MTERMTLKFVLILGLLTMIMLSAAACSSRTYAEAMPQIADVAGSEQKIELPSLVIHAKRLLSTNGAEAVYEVTADYTFHNPGPECTVRFSLPAGSLRQGNMTSGVTEVFEDGNPVKISSTSTDLSMGGQANGWGTTFEADGIKNIRFKYYIDPSVSYVDGTLPDGRGREQVVTKAQNIFFSTFEELVLPIDFDVEWVEWTGSLQVEIDLGENIPDAMVRAYPAGYEYDGRILRWDLDTPTSTSEFTAGFMRIADCLYKLEDAKQVVRTLTDRSDAGYLKGLTGPERGWYLRIARNGIFAKHGFHFSRAAKEYFDSLAWYAPNPDYSDALLSDEDKEMIGFILKAEQRYK